MTYKDYFVAEVKSNGKILRIKDGAVYLPFGSEYTLLLKNLNTKRASVSISIDGDDVLDNSSLILEPNSESELHGFLSGSVAKNRFRFINKTKQISEHRGDRADDGLIRVEFAFEKPQPEPWIVKAIEEVHHHYHYHNDTKYDVYRGTPWYSPAGGSYYTNSGGQSPEGMTGDVQSFNCNVQQSNTISQDSLGVEPNADEGITVKGSEVNQQFNYASIGLLEEAQVIVIQLKGLTQSGTTVSKPITVKTKLTCGTCGTKSKSSMKYCGTCGTFLE